VQEREGVERNKRARVDVMGVSVACNHSSVLCLASVT
jgi:hypothetical protein